MNPEKNLEEVVDTVKEKHPVFQVTKLSKYLAMVVFIIMPFIGGWIGYNLAPTKIIEITTPAIEIDEVATSTVSDDVVKEDVKTNPDSPEGDTVFTGILEAVSTDCFFDGVCSATVEGKLVILVEGWKQGVVGEVRFDDGIGGLESHIGKTVTVYADFIETGKYSLYGSEDYYIEAKI